MRVWIVKKYLETLIWKPVVLTGAAVAALLLLSLLLLPPAVAAVGVPLAVLLTAGYFALNRRCQNLCKKYAPSSYFQDLRWRNLPAIAVGSTRAWESLSRDRDEYYFAAGFRRSNAMSFHMLRTYFSHVREGGTVYYVVDPEENARIGDYISPADFLHIHPHVFLKLGIKTPTPQQRANPLVFDRGFALRFAWHDLLRTLGLTKNSRWKPARDELPGAEALSEALRGVVEFCAQRGLHCHMIFLNHCETFHPELERFAAEHKYELTCSSAASAEALRESLS